MSANLDASLALNAFNNARLDDARQNAARLNLAKKQRLSDMATSTNEAMPSNSTARLAANSEFGDMLASKITQNSTNPKTQTKQNGTQIATKSAENRANIDTKALKEQTDAFEAFFIKTILDIAINTQNPLFGKDAGDAIYNSMYNDTMSQALSGGFGFSQLLYDYLLERAN